MNAQIYCTEDEVIADLRLPGSEPGLFSRVQAASRFLERRLGKFLPMTAARTFLPSYRASLGIDPLLAVTSVEHGSVTLVSSDYALHPYGRFWENGPYTRIENLDGAWTEEVVITGRWGVYEETKSLGMSVSLTDSATTLAVSNGALVSPGMTLLVGTEQVLVSGWSAAADSGETLAADIDAASEEITVSDGAVFHEGEVIQLSTEDCRVQRVRGDTLVVGRGWNGTAKAEHDSGAAVYVRRTAAVERGVNGTTAAAHTNAAAAQLIVPEDLNWLARQIAGLMRMKAAAGFAGKSGSVEMGETFYYNEFPRQIEEIRRNWRITQL